LVNATNYILRGKKVKEIFGTTHLANLFSAVSLVDLHLGLARALDLGDVVHDVELQVEAGRVTARKGERGERLAPPAVEQPRGWHLGDGDRVAAAGRRPRRQRGEEGALLGDGRRAALGQPPHLAGRDARGARRRRQTALAQVARIPPRTQQRWVAAAVAVVAVVVLLVRRRVVGAADGALQLLLVILLDRLLHHDQWLRRVR
jgi:hypothetical protein